MATPAQMLSSAQRLLSFARSLAADAQSSLTGIEAAKDTTWAGLPSWTCAPYASSYGEQLVNAVAFAAEAADQARQAGTLASRGRCKEAVASAQGAEAQFVELEQLMNQCSQPWTNFPGGWQCLDERWIGCAAAMIGLATAIVTMATASYAAECGAPPPPPPPQASSPAQRPQPVRFR